MDYSISAIDLGEFEVTGKEGSLVLTTGVSLFFRGSRDSEQEIASDKLHNLVAEGLGFSGTTTCRLTICPLIQGIPMHREDLGPDECAFVQVLAHLVEDLDVWQQLGLRLGPTSRLYSHDESSVSFNYRIEHTDLELPGSVSTASVAAELECVRCHLDFHAQVDGLPSKVEHAPRGRALGGGRKRSRKGDAAASMYEGSSYNDVPRMIVSFTRRKTGGMFAKRETSFNREFIPRLGMVLARQNTTGLNVKYGGLLSPDSDSISVARESQGPVAAVEIAMVSDHPELEIVVRTALRHMLLGSRPRGTLISKGFAGKALTDVAPAVFDTDRLRGVAARMPLIHGPARAISYFAANAKSPSLRKKMQALEVLDQESSSGGPDVPPPLAERRLRGLIYSDSKPVSPKGSQTSGSNETVPPPLGSGSSLLGAFSEVGFGEEMLLPGEWPLLSQVSSLGEDGAGTGLSQEFIHPPGPVDDYMTGSVHCPRTDDRSQSYLRMDGVMTVMDVMGTMRMPEHAEIPRYFKEYHDRLGIRTEEVGGTGRSYYHSTESRV